MSASATQGGHKNRISSEIETSYERSTFIFKIPKLSYKTVQDKWRVDPSISFDRTPTCDRQTDGQTQGHSIHRASIASRG